MLFGKIIGKFFNQNCNRFIEITYDITKLYCFY